MTSIDTPTAWPVIMVNNVTPDDVTASLNGGRPIVFFGCVQIHPGRYPQVDIYEDLDELDRLLDRGKAEVERIRSTVKNTEPLRPAS